MAKGKRTKVVENFKEYIEELSDSGVHVPMTVKRYVSARKDIEHQFDRSFSEKKMKKVS